MGASGIFLKATGSEIFAFQCDRDFHLYYGVAMINPYIGIFDLFCDDVVRVCVGPWRGFKLVRGPQN